MDMKLEVVVIPVSDVDRAKQFYESLGWRLDADFAVSDDFRVVQLTPPGSGCSIQFGTGVTAAAPGSAQSLYLVVSDIEAARDELVARGVEVSEVFHEGTRVRGSRFPARTVASAALRPTAAATARSPRSAIRTATAGCSRRSPSGFPDGDDTTEKEVRRMDVATLTELLREAEEHHGAYEPTAPKHHWSDWYAAYIVAREQGRTPDEAYADAVLHVEGASQ